MIAIFFGHMVLKIHLDSLLFEVEFLIPIHEKTLIIFLDDILTVGSGDTKHNKTEILNSNTWQTVENFPLVLGYSLFA